MASELRAHGVRAVPRNASALLELVADGRAGLFATFAGQGTPWLVCACVRVRLSVHVCCSESVLHQGTPCMCMFYWCVLVLCVQR